jgi:hypothetical protein
MHSLNYLKMMSQYGWGKSSEQGEAQDSAQHNCAYDSSIEYGLHLTAASPWTNSLPAIPSGSRMIQTTG